MLSTSTTHAPSIVNDTTNDAMVSKNFRGEPEEFLRFIQQYLITLRPYVEQRVNMLHEDGSLKKGQYSVEEIIDEVFVAAYDTYEDKSPFQPIDQWLLPITDEVLAGFVKKSQGLFGN